MDAKVKKSLIRSFFCAALLFVGTIILSYVLGVFNQQSKKDIYLTIGGFAFEFLLAGLITGGWSSRSIKEWTWLRYAATVFFIFAIPIQLLSFVLVILLHAISASIKPLADWYSHTLQTGGYPAVALMMAVESSLFPLPSEIVIPPAAHWAHTGQIPLTLWGIVLAGTIGSWLGATVMYWASRLAGRPLVLHFGKYFFISAEKVAGAERWSAHYGAMGIFISRLLPVVRHLIGIPAGIVRMNYWIFSLYTLLGSAIWCGVLCWLGVKMGEDKDLMELKYKHVTLWLAGAMLVLGGLYYFFVHRHMAAGKAASKNSIKK
jgi:uncharacterized membrane protein YdjX (TVP38/TMEM64 family)